MSICTTKTIVFSSLKYNDTSLIVKCFTLQEGIKSYLLRGVLKSKKRGLKTAYFQPLTQLQITANHHTKNTLHTIKEVRVIHPYETIYTSIIKQSIVLFLSEVLSTIIKEEEANELLYNYIETSLVWLDTHHNIANFHLLFLLNLSKYLGFYPDISEQEKKGFDLLEGNFSNTTHKNSIVSGKKLILFKKLLGINFDSITEVSFSKNERQIILQMLMNYFELHLDGFKKPKSLDILKTVFN